jgi:hypothetical protein
MLKIPKSLYKYRIGLHQPGHASCTHYTQTRRKPLNFPPISLYYRGKYLIELLVHKSSSRSITRKTYYVLPWKTWGCREGKQPYDRPMRNESDANKRGYQLQHILCEQILSTRTYIFQTNFKAPNAPCMLCGWIGFRCGLVGEVYV